MLTMDQDEYPTAGIKTMLFDKGGLESKKGEVMKQRRNDLGIFKKGKVFINEPSNLKNWS